MSRADEILNKHGFSGGGYFSPISQVNNTGPSIAQPKQQQPGFLGNVFNSIKSGVGTVANYGLNAAKRTFVDEPLNYGKYLANTIVMNPYKAAQAGDKNAFRKATLQGLSAVTNAWMPGSGGVQLAKQVSPTMRQADTEYAKAAAPLVLTGLTLGSGKAASTVAQDVGGGAVGALRRGVGRIAEDTFGTGKTFGNNALTQLAGKAVRNELLVRPTAETFPQIANQIGSGDYVGAATNAALLASGGLKLKGAAGPIGAAEKGLTSLSSQAGKLFVDKAGVFDMIKVKGGSVTSQLKKIAKSDPEKAQVLDEVLRVAQDNILRQYKGDRKAAAKLITQYIDVAGKKNLSKMNIEKFANELDSLAQSNLNIQKLVAKGKNIVDAKGNTIPVSKLTRIGAVKSTQAEKSALTKALKATKSPEEVDQVLNEFLAANPRFAQNQQNLRAVAGIKEAGSFGDSAAALANEGLTGTNQLFVKGKNGKLKPVEFDNGYTLGLRAEGSAPFRTVEKTAQLEQGKNAPLGFVNKAMEKVGLSAAQQTEFEGRAQYNKVQDIFNENLRNLGIKRSAGDVMKTLQDAAEKKWGVFDLRQLRPGEVAEALRINKDEAKQVIKAYKQAVSKLSLSERGLAGKLTDLNLNYNPIAAPYSRVQNTLKYEKNPFFSLQERIETRLGVASLGAGTRRPRADYSKQVQSLEDMGFFKGASFGSEGADVGGIKGITSKLKTGQKETIAAGMENLAQKQGKTLREFYLDPKNADLIQDFKTVVQYPDKGFTSSNLSKMLNLVTFPMRYNIKLTQFAVRQLAKQPGIVQVQTIKGLNDWYNFMDSPEGIKFQADNKEALGILKYFSPTYNIDQVIQILRGRGRSIGDFGMVGGLPFGVITQALQGQGLIKTDSAYVDPRTGKVYSDKIPTSLKGRAYQLLSDVIGTMYNYPGRQVGAEMSKKDLNEVIPKSLLGKTSKADYTNVERTDITPEDKKRIQVLGAGSGQASQLPVSAPTYTGPTLKMPTKAPVNIAPIYSKKKAKRGRVPSIPIAKL